MMRELIGAKPIICLAAYPVNMEFLTSAIVTQAGGDSAMGDGMRRFVLGLFIVIAVWMPSAQADAQRPYAQGLLWRIR